MQFEDFISTERLKTYQDRTDRHKKAVALHNHTLQLGASLMAMIALLELSLRNVTNKRLTEDFGDPDWLLPGHTALPLKSHEQSAIRKAYGLAQKAAYARLGHREKRYMDAFAFPAGVPANLSHKNIVQKRQAMFYIPHGQVISQTTLALWKRLYSSDYENTLWKQSLKKVFPDKSLTRGEVSRHLEAIYAAKNRVAHHEPVYGNRLENTMEAIQFVRDTIGARKQGEDSSFRKFSKVHYLRLQMDYESFIEAWHTLT